MTFADLPAGASIFLDANPLVYHFAPDPKFGAASSQLLARIVTIMQAHDLTSLASNDTDFDRVPGITRFAPV